MDHSKVDLATLYQNLSVAMCMVGRDGRLLIVNRLHAELAGLACEQLIGMRVADLNEEGGRNVERDFRHFDKGLDVPDHELVIGDRVYLVSTSPVHDGSGKVVAISVAHIDITEKRAMERRNARVNRQLRTLASYDHLTKTLNRREFDKLVKRAGARLTKRGDGFSVLLVDVDHFKNFNDIYGHQAGDTCLRNVATALRSQMRSIETSLCRYGGEEFAIVLNHEEGQVAAQIAERMIAGVSALAIPHDGGIGGRVTISCGVASSSCLAEGVGAAPGTVLVGAADRALYEAKAAGRNCYRVAAPPGIDLSGRLVKQA